MTDSFVPATAAVPAKTAGAAVTGKGQTVEQMRQAAADFEAVFLSQMLATMTQELGGAGAVAGGDIYRDMFTQEIAKMISRSGGIGVADSVLREMLKTQEVT